MVAITLTNHNPNSQDLEATIHLHRRICSFPDNREMSLSDFLQQSDFKHPLLTKPKTLNDDAAYHYEFENDRSLFGLPGFVYQTLLYTDEPARCTFQINPAQNFQYQQCEESIHFSIDSTKPAKETISIKQLNAIVSEVAQFKFAYSDDLTMYDTFGLHDLPLTVNADTLFIGQEHLYELLENPSDLSRFELRYINPVMGFGVYSRTLIKADELVGVYTGVKINRNQERLNYCFLPAEDCFNMCLDAKYYGNITRFVNHAPDPEKEDAVRESTLGQIANLDHSTHYLHGISIIVYRAKRDIEPGEQLLIDYGSSYFVDIKPTRFKAKNRQVNFLKFFAYTNLPHIKIMASNGVKSAQAYIYQRLLLIVAGISLAACGLQLLT